MLLSTLIREVSLCNEWERIQRSLTAEADKNKLFSV